MFELKNDKLAIPIVLIAGLFWSFGPLVVRYMNEPKLVFPGAKLDGESLTNLMNDEKVTISLGVPTIWLLLLNYLRG